MLERKRHLAVLKDRLETSPVVAILGPRQVGKTTLARQLAGEMATVAHFFDLENPVDLARLSDPMLALAALEGLVVLDEVQRRPDLFPVLRVLADRPELPARFLVLGSASPDLLRQSSETLAGRIHYYELPPLTLDEVGIDSLQSLHLRGGFPRSFLARNDAASARWREDFVRTFLERDIPALGFRVPPATLERFWSMLAHYHSGIWNAAELARSLAVSAASVRHYLDILTATFVVRELKPWFENLDKRQVKAPKVYLRDSGLLHTLLRIGSQEELLRHPKLGASWEGFALETVVARLGADPRDCYFWSTHSGAELDLLVHAGGHRLGFEFKHASAPTPTRSMYIALEDLKLTELIVIHAGTASYPLANKMRAVPLERVWQEIDRLA